MVKKNASAAHRFVCGICELGLGEITEMVNSNGVKIPHVSRTGK